MGKKCWLTFFQLQRDFYSIHVHTDNFYLFLLQKRFCVGDNHIFTFCFFLILKDFDTFHKPFFKALICFYNNTQMIFFYLKKKCLINLLYTLKN